MPSPDLIRAFLSQASSSGSRSTALQPLGWLCAILTSGLALAATWSAPEWAMILLGSLLGITVAIYLISYVFYAIKNPDALRSEKYTLSKMAIEKNLIGDSESGLLKVGDYEQPTHAPTLPSKKEPEA